MKFLNVILTVVLLFAFTSIFSQTDSLIIFTKQGCSNCKYTKEQFTKNSIKYIEYNLEDRESVIIMLKRLSKIGYHNQILLPVIFLNNNLLHPAFATDTSLIKITLLDAIDSLLLLQSMGKLFLVEVSANNDKLGNLYKKKNVGCEVNLEPIYLIFQNFTDEKAAQKYAEELKKQGYNNAGVLNYKKYFRVYNKLFLDADVANEELIRYRKTNRVAYLLVLD